MAKSREVAAEKTRKRKKIAVTFILNIGSVIVLMFAILGVITYYSVDGYSRQNAYSMASIAMSGVNKELSLKLDDIDLLARSLADLDDVRSYDYEKAGRILATTVQDRSAMIRAIIVARADGSYVIRGEGPGFARNEIAMPDGYNPVERTWYRTAMSVKDSSFTGLYQLDTSGTLGLAASIPIRDSARNITGVLAIELTLDGIQNIIKELALPLGGKGFIVTNEGREVVNQIDQGTGTGKELARSKIEEIDSIVMEKIGQRIITYGDQKYFASFALNKQTQYIIIVAFPFDRIMQDSIRTIQTLVALFFVFTFVVLAVIVTQIRRTLRPINPLVIAIRAMHDGKLSARAAVSTENEIGELAENFNEMAESIEVKNIKILRANEELEQKVEERTAELKESNDQLLRDLKMAQRIQLAIIPQEDQFPQREEMNFGARYSAMENLGGDLYDIIRIGRNAYGFVMADVSGHGVPAALITTMAKVSFHSHAKWGMTTSEILDGINAEMYRFIGDLEYYLTAFFCVLNLETGELQYTNAGHHAGIVYRKSTGKMDQLDTKGYFIGSFEDGNYETKSTTIEPGDRILLFTDGIIEARNEQGEFYEYNRLRNYVKERHALSPRDFVSGLAEDLRVFCGKAPQTDDQAILQIEFVKRIEADSEGGSAMDIQVKQINRMSEPEEAPVVDYAGRYAAALAAMKSGDTAEAMRILDGLLEARPDDVKVLNNLGVLHYRMGDLPAARDFLKRAIQVEPDNQGALKNLKAVEKALVASR